MGLALAAHLLIVLSPACKYIVHRYTVKKQTKQVISPSKVGIQVMREKFEEMNNNNEINPTDYQKFQEVFTGWKNTKGLGKKQKLKEAQQLYRAVIYPKLKSK